MINRKQKMLLHIYKGAAGLNDATYRNLLREHASVSSAADRRFSQYGFDRTMAAIEEALFAKVHRGEVNNPIGRNRWIGDEFYWRNRLPNAGMINSRQHHKIRQVWAQLTEFLPVENTTTAYLSGIINRSIGRRVELCNMTHKEAEFVIDALKDRLAYAIRKENDHEPLQSLPF